MRLFSLLAALAVGCDGESADDKAVLDADLDGYLDSVDCDESDAAIHPGADEVCDGVDQDCDGEADDGVGSAWFTDGDGDGYGDATTGQVACDQPEGSVADATDCDDNSADYHPAAVEDDCTNPADYNCDGSVGYADADADGFAACDDCDDGAALVNRAATETCNDADDDCDTEIDEDVQDTFYADADGDGYGDPANSTLACAAGVGWVANADDCNDANPGYNPAANEVCSDPNDYNCDGSVGYADADNDGFAACDDCNDADIAINAGATELCDLADNDCDGSTDENDAADAKTWYFDADGDGHGGVRFTEVSCVASTDYVASADDCNDLDAKVSPSANETCGGEDEDCDGLVDEDDAVDPATWYLDEDDDGYGDATATTVSCDVPPHFVGNGDDCDDSTGMVNPDAAETCDEVDNNCDGVTDEDSAADATTWYADVDGDNYGATYTLAACAQPAGYVALGTDCDDADVDANPAGTEVCDGDDDDCDGTIDEDDAADATAYFVDADLDGFGDPATWLTSCTVVPDLLTDGSDCDDDNAGINPDATEVCDDADVDEDCDALVDNDDASVTGTLTLYPDTDGDGYGDAISPQAACDVLVGYTLSWDDCNDASNLINPGVSEVCDALDTDEDCNGTADNDDAGATGGTAHYLDTDSDGYGDPATADNLCDVIVGYTTDATDCDDESAAAYPGAAELCDGVDTDCSGIYDDGMATATYYPDEDGDGFGDELGTTVDACLSPLGYGLDGSDCDDTDMAVHPYAWEDTSNGIDDDCDAEVDTADTTTVSAGPTTDDGSTRITLSNFSFPYCGVNRTSVYAQSNGWITFGAADPSFEERASVFAYDMAIAAAWDDLDPSAAGEISYVEYTDALGVYWNGVRELDSTTTNTFSTILFDDGRVLLQYGDLAMTDGLVGYSCAPGTVTESELDMGTGMDDLAAGRWGLGHGTERLLWELFVTDNDLDNRVVRLCPYVDGTTDLCAE